MTRTLISRHRSYDEARMKKAALPKDDRDEGTYQIRRRPLGYFDLVYRIPQKEVLTATARTR